MNTLRTEVRLFAESGDFDPDRLNYMDCPECGGKSKCMVVPAENGRGYYFKCFRDSCGVNGLTGGKGRELGHLQPAKLSRRSIFPAIPTRDLQKLSWGQYKYFREKYRMTAPQVNRLADGYDPMDSATIFPIRDPLGEQRGYVRRYFDGRLPKAPIRPYEETGPLTAWYRPYDVSVYNAPLVLVEDQISAARLSADVPTVALLGTRLGLSAEAEVITWCRNHKGCPVIVSLDEDATTTGIALKSELNGLPHVTAYYGPLVVDIKDMSPEVYDDYLKQLRMIMNEH